MGSADSPSCQVLNLPSYESSFLVFLLSNPNSLKLGKRIFFDSDVTSVRREGDKLHNAVIALGPRVYLEILAPDPKQPNPRSLPSLGLSETRRSRMVGWALNAPDLEGLIASAGGKGVPMVGPTSGGRQRPDGYQLSWRIATLADRRIGDGLAPFFIDWGTTEHPTVGSPKGARLISLRAQYPTPQPMQAVFDSLDIPFIVEGGAEPALIAVLDTPRGRIELR